MEARQDRLETILEEAARLTSVDRQATYGPPWDDFECTGRLWAALLSRHLGQRVADLPPELVGLMMIALKLSREVHVAKRDNRVDIIGYANCVQMTHDHREGKRTPVDGHDKK